MKISFDENEHSISDNPLADAQGGDWEFDQYEGLAPEEETYYTWGPMLNLYELLSGFGGFMNPRHKSDELLSNLTP